MKVVLWDYYYLFIHWKYNLDEQGTPYCCGGPIPDEFVSSCEGCNADQYDSGESINKM